eukprot:NODE_2636_length_2175_cov_4.805176.p1 GENE.NODE_2636_length_2175_cov_4.805176~~NODE_2636_length_2175_cov_4.805176.p1  ORF type:complete len:568 (-),score=117.24 NODE_2636_length_2175_cov_4.805176:373-2076(-)
MISAGRVYAPDHKFDDDELEALGHSLDGEYIAAYQGPNYRVYVPPPPDPLTGKQLLDHDDWHAYSPLCNAYFQGDRLRKDKKLFEALRRIEVAGLPEAIAMKQMEDLMAPTLGFKTSPNWNGKQYDIIIYGMSGYTGYLCMNYLKSVSLRLYPGEFTCAFAGLYPHRIKEMRDRVLGNTSLADTAIIKASLEDVQDVIDLVSSARVIINFAGPYMHTQGELLVDTCVHLGVDYLDVSGELPWTMRLQSFGELAEKNDVLVLPSASPVGTWADMVVHSCSKKLREDYGEETRKATCFLTAGGGNASYGTLRTRAVMNEAGDEVRRTMADPFSLGGFVPSFDRYGVKEANVVKGTGVIDVKMRGEDLDAQMAKVSLDPVAKVWRAPIPYSYFDSRIVRLANAIRADRLNQPYGRYLNFQMSGMLPYDPEDTEVSASPYKQSYTVDKEREKLQSIGKYYQTVGSGTQVSELGDAFFCIQGYCESTSGHTTMLGICGLDGYTESARTAIEGAMVLLKRRSELPIQGGVIPPATALGELLLERLVASGIRVSIDRLFGFEELVGNKDFYQDF